MKRSVKAWGLFKMIEQIAPVEVDTSRVSIEFTFDDWGGKSEGYEIRPVEIIWSDDCPAARRPKGKKGGRRG